VLARRIFTEQEALLLAERVQKQMDVLEGIKRSAEEAQRELEKQRMAMKLNEEMQNLKTMNFERFKSTIANLMELKRRM
jgi:hypothetical protein